MISIFLVVVVALINEPFVQLDGLMIDPKLDAEDAFELDDNILSFTVNAAPATVIAYDP